MSEIAAIAGSSRLRVSVRVSADALAVTGLALTCGLLVWLTWSTWGNIGRDTGYDFVAATRVAHGEWPYLDFVYYYGPLSPLLAGLAVWIGGGGLAPLIGFGLLLATAIVFATYLLARRFVEPAWATVAAALTAPVAFSPNNFSYVAPHTYGAPLGILSILLFLWAAAHYAQSRSPRMLVLSGGFAGLVTVTRPEFVPAVILAAALWLGLRARTRDGGWREIVRFGSPLVAVPAVVYGAFLTRISLHQLIFDNLYPRRALAAGASHVLRLHAPLTFLSFAHLGAKLALYAFGAVLLVLLSNALAQARWIWRAASIALVAALAIAALARLETARYALGYAVGWIPAGVAAVVILLVLQRRRNAAEWSSADQAALLGAVVLTVLGAKEYDSFLVEASHPQPAVYLVPLAAIFLAVLHRRLARGARAGRLAGIAWLAFYRTSRLRADRKGRPQRVRSGPRPRRHAPSSACRRLRVPASSPVDRAFDEAGRADHAGAPVGVALHPVRPDGPVSTDLTASDRSADCR